MNNKYDAIISDLGNVLIDFDHRIAVRKILEHTSKSEKEIYDLFFDSGLTELYEEGKISSPEFFDRVRKYLDLNIDSDTFFPIWSDIFFETHLNRKMHDLLKRAKPSLKLILMSNLNETHFNFLKPRMDIFKDFDKLILSYEVGFRKPAYEIYKEAIDFADTSPSRLLYIDDRADLIEAASEFGISGIVFNGESSFNKILKELEMY